jgi:hypothetical protein
LHTGLWFSGLIVFYEKIHFIIRVIQENKLKKNSGNCFPFEYSFLLSDKKEAIKKMANYPSGLPAIFVK